MTPAVWPTLQLRSLEGLLMVVKANIDTAGLETNASNLALKGLVPKVNAPLVQRLEDAGAIIIGKTNMPDLAGSLTGYNPGEGFDHTWNPHALGYGPGGSSSGTAAAIAAGMAPCGLGSDTAGSLRIPAENCGVAGMRPSKCRYEQAGCVPLGRPDCMGAMGLTVADISLLDAVMAGEEGCDDIATATGAPADLSGLKVCMPSAWVGENISAGHKAALDLAVAALTEGGATIVDDPNFVSFDKMLNEAAPRLYPMGGPATNLRELQAYLDMHKEELPEVTVEKVVSSIHWTNPIISMTLLGDQPKRVAGMSADEYQAEWEPLLADKAALEAALEAYMTENGIAFLLTPICVAPPFRNASGPRSFAAMEAACAAAKDSGNFGARVGTFFPLYMPNEIAPIKLKMLDLDVPSITIPTAARHSVEGATLPAGILIWGKPRSDRQLLALGMALEKKLAPH